MGATNYESIPQAVLLDNPGLTLKGLVRKFNSIHFSRNYSCYHKCPWDDYGQNKKDKEWECNIFKKKQKVLKNVLGLNPEASRRTIFSKKRGKLTKGLIGANTSFWIQKKGRYFLDMSFLDQIDDDLYSCLILTAEAIKNKAWNFLCYDGRRNVQRFLYDHPSSLKRYSKAIFDLSISRFAQKRGFTNIELLRFRAPILYVPPDKDLQFKLMQEEMEKNRKKREYEIASFVEGARQAKLTPAQRLKEAIEAGDIF